MVRQITLSIAILLMAPLIALAQDEDDAMIREYEKFVKNKGGQTELKNDPDYRASLGRRTRLSTVVNAAVSEQEKALIGTKTDIENVITLYASRAQSRGNAIDHYLYGRILGQTGELDEAYREFKTALGIDRYLTWAWDGLGVYHSNKENWPQAIEKFKRVIQLWPGHIKATFGLAQCYFRINKFNEGVVRLQEILSNEEVRDDPRALRQTRLLISEAFRSQRKFTDAVDILTDVIDTDGNDTRVLTMRAWCSRRLDRHEDAAKDYEAILVLEPKSRRFYEQLADSRLAQGRNAEAIRVLERLLVHASDDQTASQLEKYHEAIVRLKKKPAKEDPKDRDPTLDDYINNLANSPHEEKRREAVVVLSKAPPMKRDDPRAKILRKAFITALRDVDHVVRCIALEQMNVRFGDERVLNVTKLFANQKHEKDPRVRGMANHILQDYPPKMVTPSLIMSMKTETDVYAFRRIHESLNATTLAWIERVIPNDLEIVDIVRIRNQWLAWYKRNRDLYRKHEPKDFDLK
ncbi:MAG: tetratricopeptide (TPR) repeat protein [Planctomycetota bacterium]|jgi:tetratricopeptide (TPR) repeat protein